MGPAVAARTVEIDLPAQTTLSVAMKKSPLVARYRSPLVAR